jgi:hypothetical protein
MKPAIRALAFLAFLWVVLHPAAPAASGAVPADRTVILISLDGVGADLLDRARTPALDALARRGVLARRLSPPFPSNTFPSHATMATGVFPDKHGIVSDKFMDRKRGRFDKEHEASWQRAEPIWVTAERQGVKAAVVMWAVSEWDWRGTHPAFSMRFHRDASDERWADLIARSPPAEPRLILAGSRAATKQRTGTAPMRCGRALEGRIARPSSSAGFRAWASPAVPPDHRVRSRGHRTPVVNLARM